MTESTGVSAGVKGNPHVRGYIYTKKTIKLRWTPPCFPPWLCPCVFYKELKTIKANPRVRGYIIY